VNDAEFMIIDGIEIPTQIEFSKQFEDVKLQGTVIGSVSEDQQLVKYEIWQTFETEQFSLQVEQVRGTETVSLYIFDQAATLELKMLQTANKIMQITINDQDKLGNSVFQLVRDTKYHCGILPIFNHEI